jgi:hypothetical protein
MQVQADGRVRKVQFTAGHSQAPIKYLKNYYEQGLPVFPWYEVSPGYSWTQTTKVILPQETMEAVMNYRVASLAREIGYDCAVIESDGEMIIPVEPSEDGSSQASGYDRIKTTGVLYFAYKDGIVVRQREQWSIDRVRPKTFGGATREYREAVELNIEYILRGKTVIAALAP